MAPQPSDAGRDQTGPKATFACTPSGMRARRRRRPSTPGPTDSDGRYLARFEWSTVEAGLALMTAAWASRGSTVYAVDVTSPDVRGLGLAVSARDRPRVVPARRLESRSVSSARRRLTTPRRTGGRAAQLPLPHLGLDPLPRPFPCRWTVDQPEQRPLEGAAALCLAGASPAPTRSTGSTRTRLTARRPAYIGSRIDPLVAGPRRLQTEAANSESARRASVEACPTPPHVEPPDTC